jgi:hypothetical protein
MISIELSEFTGMAAHIIVALVIIAVTVYIICHFRDK